MYRYIYLPPMDFSMGFSGLYLEDGLPGLGYVVIGSPPYISAIFMALPQPDPWGDENDHHSY